MPSLSYIWFQTIGPRYEDHGPRLRWRNWRSLEQMRERATLLFSFGIISQHSCRPFSFYSLHPTNWGTQRGNENEGGGVQVVQVFELGILLSLLSEGKAEGFDNVLGRSNILDGTILNHGQKRIHGFCPMNRLSRIERQL
ncbi:hypothetical protein N7519_011060 [Penicillium mononematosum]|uniref:uncharacterized protein n=1 Tax=Penicillium mononematosum TaxID=268346 RepID=UPI002548D256|nr:uncharacterized protein N7519_011060 [Penicillium mononematosum]KAJ6180599.1 hypothetical protein N7519_011060 [Penicillium mononematosum]